MSVPTHDEDGVPIKYLVLCSAPSPNRAFAPQVLKEIMGVIEMLEKKQRFQKAANLLYACVLADSNNEQLRARWGDLIAKVNTQNIEIHQVKDAKAAEQDRALESKINKQNAAALSQTKRWQQLRDQGGLPPDDPNWHIGRLRPWMVPQAMERGMAHKSAAQSAADPFQKLYAYEEASKMFTRVLEVKQVPEARAAFNECCAAMNGEYQRMKQVKRQTKALNPDAPMTKIGDFNTQRTPWVQGILRNA